MADAALSRPEPVEWAFAGRAIASEVESGDRHVVAARPSGVLLALIDGLGHGDEAAKAARAAAAAIERHSADALEQILRRCHEASIGTRGSVIALAAIDGEAHQLTWSGIGNAAAVLFSGEAEVARRSIRSVAGIVGSRLPAMHSETLPLHDGDLIVLSSDGIRSGFASPVSEDRPVQTIADELLSGHALSSDDALVLIARYHREAT